ncbi:adenylosuccinate synthase [Jeotgalibaca caeni]|uniref:adenylosuccinate synthase n=1 Tax=Jeotgalibaca caeni TaxID=3028623 RepID=UPI00237ECADE|nr:adenylosuccinate synthase [Jeotgalibaca caeni]MDE1549224.1 adenylosuccinate synthase [Jeotgalibaca caeni]
MKKLAIIGAQWGDEGKGKIVNYFSSHYDYIIRFSGGANAGHTIYYNGKKYVNHLLPSISPETESIGILSKGMALDLGQVIVELETMETDFSGISKRFIIDEEAFLVLPYHKEEDAILESMRKKPIGTTKKGMGPSFADKVSRENIRVCDLYDPETLYERLGNILYLKNKIYGDKLNCDVDAVYQGVLEQFATLRQMGVQFTSAASLYEELQSKKVLFEGAQGIMLDIDSGTYPYVTSSQTTAHGSFTVDMTLTEEDTVMGVVKAYTTRVGEGEFPTELPEEEGEVLRRLGNEFGATTGRNRRVGWLDLPQLRYAIRKSKLNSIVITKGDILNQYDEVKVCVAYEVDGKTVDMPFIANDFRRAKPIYKTLPGWNDVFDLNFLKYITFMEQELGVDVSYVSYGPKTEEMMSKKDYIMHIHG